MKTTTKSVLAALILVAFATLPPACQAAGTDPFTITSPFTSQGVFSCTDLTMSGNAVINSAGIAKPDPTNKGNVRVNGNITMSGNSVIDGDATVGPAKKFTLSGPAKVTGTSAVATSTMGCTPIDLAPVKTALQASNDNAKIPKTGKGQTVLSGTNFTMSGNDTLTIPAGTYYFTNMAISGSSTITLGGPVRILCTGSLSISGGSFINPKPYEMRLWVSGASVAFSGNTTFQGFIYAPSASVSLAASQLIGGVFANSISLSGTAHITRSIDDVAPRVTITSPADNSLASDPAHVLVKGTVADDQTDVGVKVNGQTATIAADDTWQITLDLSSSASPVTVSAVATDAAGNFTTVSIRVLLPLPSISLTSPLPGSFLATRSTNLSGSVANATSVKVNGIAATIGGGLWSLNNFDLGNDGAHTLSITGTNAAGITTISPVLTNDTTVPTVSAAVAPSPNAAGWNKSSATVSFTCSDATSGIATCPAPVTVSAETSSQTVSGTATDKAGNQKIASVVVKLDSTAPLIAITTPNSGATVTSSTLPVSGTVSDSRSGVGGVTCNGGPATLNGGMFNCVVTLVAGNNTITTIATDVAGNPATVTRQVTYTPDLQAPVITITSPVNNSSTRQTSITVSGTATDDVAVASVTVNGSPVTLTNNTWTTTVTLTGPDGPKTITATATDNSGKQNTATAQITLDTTPPLVAITSPGDGTSVTTPTLSISGTVSDATSGVHGVTCNSVAASVTGTTYTCSVALSAGLNTITATATDGVGNTSIPAVIHATYTPDTKAPTITITTPANGAFVKDTTLTVSGTANDDVSVASVTVNGATVPYSNGTWTTTLTLTSDEGAKSITAIATDGSGNSTPATVQVTLDTTPPVVAITSPADKSSGTSATLAVSGSVNDARSGVASVTCNNVNGIVSNSTFTCTVPLVAGDNLVTAIATDKAGNTSAPTSIHVTYTPDTQAPVITITTPAAGTFTKVRTLTVSGTATDDVSVAKVTVEGVEVPLTNGTWTTTLNLSGPDGSRTITATATDGTGKSTDAHVTFGLDTTPPTLAITAPPNHSSGTDSSITVSGTVTDDTAGVDHVTCNGANATLTGGTFSCHVTLVPGDNLITATATDKAGNSIDAVSHAVYTPDSQAPTITITSPADGTFTPNATVTVTGTANDDVAVAKVTVNGVQVPLTSGTWTTTLTLTAGDGLKTITAVATDTTGKSTPATIQITLDTTPPAVTITTPAAGATVANPALTISGTVTDAGAGVAGVTCNGTPATITSGTFTCNVTLVEGSNTIAIVATDKVGNQATPPLAVQLDTRAPEVVVSAPVANVCVNATSLQVAGRATDPHLGTIKLSITPGAGSITVTPATDGTFNGTLPLGPDGKYVVAVEAADAVGHTAVATIPLTVDRTVPAIEITSGGATFTGGAFNHAISINVRGIDADPTVVLTTTLGSTPYVAGTPVAAEGQYVLNVTARDCAGNTKQASVSFKIDTTAPHISGLTPATGSTVASATTAVTGNVDADDLRSVVIEGTPIAGTITGRNFTVNPSLAEGTNNLVLVATDDAGNSTRQSYSVTVKSTTPSVQILENGLPIAANALFNRNVTPLIVSNETAAHTTATLDTVSYNSGTVIFAEGPHTIVAHASDDYGHHSDATATLTIDKTPPTLTISEPADGATLAATTVDVKGNAGDAVRVTVNGAPATLGAGGAFSATIPLDLGTNPILVTASDAAGNSATASRSVSRNDARPGLVLTTPADGTITNHITTTVAGQVLTPSLGAHVTINGADITPDTAGVFRIDAFPLHDGDNVITAAIAGNTQSSVTVHVLSDIIPPTLKVLANGSEMQPAARFATSPTIALQPTDNNPTGLTTTLTIDGAAVTGATPVLATGGHVLTAVARDAAHNEARVDRTFSVGSSGSTNASGCTLSNFDPPNNAAVFSSSITFSGRSGGATAVFVNSTRVTPAEGSFASSLALTNEGANSVTIKCADASGNPASDGSVSMTIYRYTNAPSISITAPSNEAVLNASTVTVTGTVGSDVVSGDVNGVAFTPSGGTFSVPNVSLVTGLNVITARCRNAAERVGVATVRVTVANGAPSITITSPLPATQTSATTIDVSGTWKNIDPATLRVAGVTPTPKATTDTTGNFVANVPINPNATTTITVTGQNGAGVQATASVDVQNIAGPSISIATPADNTWYPATAAAPDTITGTISAPAASTAASTVSVNGVNATLTGNQFSASIAFPAGASGITTVLARVTAADGASATDSIRLIKMPAALTVTSSFPEANATSVDAGALVVVLFSNPLDGTTKSGAVTFADDAGHTITGVTFVDNDALSFAPNVPLEAGRHYTFTVGQTLKDRAGQALASPFVLGFTAALGASGIAPAVTSTGPLQGCLSTVNIAGTASASGVRVRITVDGISTSTSADANKIFTFTVSLSGQPGYHVARIREVGPDGSLSPETDVTYEINCGGPTGPTVTGATLDRNAKTLAVQFSKPMTPATLTASATGTIQLAAGTTVLAGSVAMNATNDVATITYSGDVSIELSLTVTTGAHDATGAALASNYLQTFPAANQALGNGYITGAVFDATTGRPLPGAAVTITPSASGTTTTDRNGRYTMSALGEGAFTIQASAAGFSTVWRQVVVPAGSGVVPIDIRLTKRGTPQNGGSDLTLQHGGDTPVTKPVRLFVPAAALASGTSVSLTAVGGQSLGGLLPLGWSPLASAEIALGTSSIPAPLSASRLTFVITSADADALTAATQTLSVVQYDNARDEWRTVVAAAIVAAGSDSTTRVVTADIQTSGNYALVYPDKGSSGLVSPEAARTGTALQGVPNPCGNTPALCQPTSKGFTIDPPSVTPTQRATATLTTDGADKTVDGTLKIYPSGTAVQAYIDEQLTLTDGTVSNGAPYATDLLLYRAPSGATATALFHVAPSPDAANPVLRDGVDHVRVVDYPGRIDRGTLIGSEGGRIPGDDTISIQIPQGATTEALHASVVPLTATDLQSFGAIPGFHIAGGFTLALSVADPNAPKVDLNGDGIPDVVPVTLLKPAQGTFTIDLARFATANRQVVIAEVIDKSSYGSLIRLAATTTAATTPVANVRIVATDAIDPTKLPLDGIVHDGRYLILTPDNDVAFAWGQVRFGSPTGVAVSNSLVTAATLSKRQHLRCALGVRDITRSGGVFAIPIVAQPAAAFGLKPRSVATGDGDVTTNAAPAAEAKVAVGTLVLAPQPLQLVSITPNKIEVPTSGFQAVATFNIAVNAASVSGKMIVKNITTGTVVPGTIAGDGGVHVTFTPAQSLASGSTYSIVVQSGILSTGGAPLAAGGSATFTTPALPPANSNIDPTKIQITIPENGVSTIKGTAGALPVGAVALAIRRNQYFVEQYQKQVGSDGTTDGSFSFDIGKAGGADRVTINDHIDLQIQDAVSHSTVAILPLTPFVTKDGLGFVAPPDQTVTFTSVPPLSVSVTVPAGAFDKATIVTLAAAPKADFAAVPSFDTELGFYGAITLTFDGIAKKPLDVDIPAPAGTDTTKTYLLGRLGDSIRGPRVEIDALLSLAGGKFTTRAQGTTSGQRVTRSLSIGRNNTLVGGDVRTNLLRIIESGKYTVTDIRVPTGSALGWAAMDGLQADLDIFMDLYHSLFVSSLYLSAGHGRVVVPVISGTPFTVQGVDSATGIQLFEHKYDALAPTAPGQFVGVPSPIDNTSGPYPVFGDPFKVQSADVVSGVAQITSIPGVVIDTAWATSTDKGNAVLSFADTSASPDPPRRLSVYNVRSGDLQESTGAPSVSITAHVGDRLVVYSQSERVDSRSDLAIVFNEAIKLPYDPAVASQADIDAAMRPLFSLEKNMADPASGGTEFQKLDGQTTFQVDSGNRRVFMHADLQAGAEYRVVLDPSISDTDPTTPLTLMHVPSGPASPNLYLYFAVRDPKGKIAQFDLPVINLKQGSVRDLALDGNLLLVSAQSGGLLAFDASDPASLGTSTNKFAWATALGGESWSIFVDNHGRIWTTALTSEFGVVRTFRTEDFVNSLSTNPNPTPVTPFAGGTVSWRTGVTTGANEGISLTLNSDRPEAIPRKLQIVTQDDTLDMTAGDDLDAKLASNTLQATGHPTGQTYDDITEYSITVPTTPSGFPYVTQRITVRNVTLGLRWSADGKAGPAAGPSTQFDHVLVRSGDRIRIERNVRTYGVVSLFGYGVGVYDLNAIESNSRVAQGAVAPGYKSLGTLVDLTDGQGTMTFTPDAIVFADNSSTPPALTAVACAAASGVAIFQTHPTGGAEDNGPAPAYTASAQSTPGYVIPLVSTDTTLKAIRFLVSHNETQPFMGRFNSISRYDVDDNNGTHHSYGLVSGGLYGILVLDLTDDPSSPSLVDVIWVPQGAWAVRYIGGRYATSLDGSGKTLLIDLSRLGESTLPKVAPCGGCTPVFPTLASSLAAGGDSGNYGTDDPRIVWRGKTGAMNTTLAAVGDIDTGFLFGGTLLQPTVRVESGIDPQFAVKARLANGMTSVTSIVPLGIKPPSGSVDPSDPNTSLAAFRVETSLPVGVPAPAIAIESQRVVGVATEQTPAPLPKSNLRQSNPSGGNDTRPTTVTMRTVLTPALLTAMPSLKLQRGANRFVSPWIVAMTDPRASKDYNWSASSATKEDLGCPACDRPASLQSASLGTDYFELYTLGNFISIRPEASAFTGSNYGWLGQAHRLETRVATIRADTVRPADDRIASLTPPTTIGPTDELVYPHSGEVAFATTDLAIKGRGLDFELLRSYSSGAFHLGPLGRNMDSPLFARLRLLPDGSVDYFDGTGRVDHFVLNGNSFAPPPGVFLDLVRYADGTYALVTPERSIVRFDPYGRITSTTDRNATKLDGSDGNRMSFLYDARGLLVSVIDTTGRRIDFTYDADRPWLLTTVRDFDGRTVTYGYDAAQRLTTVTSPDPLSASSAQQATTYVWSAAPTSGDLRSVTYIGAQLVAIRDALGRTPFAFGYQSSKPWSAASVTTSGSTWQVSAGSPETTITSPLGAAWTYAHDSAGNILAVTAPAVGSSAGAITTYGYDASGRLTTVTSPLGDATTYVYSGDGEGNARKLGNITQVINSARAGSPEKALGTLHTTTIGYGTANMPTTIASADGSAITVVRDARGNATSITDASGVTVSPHYDQYGLLRQLDDPRTGSRTYGYGSGAGAGYLMTVTTTAGTTTYGSDTRGNTTSITDPSGRTIAYTVNKLDQVEKEVRGDSVTTNTFDAAGNAAATTVLLGVDAAGNPQQSTTTHTIDESGRLRQQNENGRITTYTYDRAGNLSTVAGPAGATATYAYDARNRLTSATQAGHTATYAYDDNGAVIAATNGRGKTSTFRTDGFGHPLAKTNPLGVTSVTTADPAGRVIDSRVVKSLADGSATLLRWETRRYDPAGRVTAETQKLFVGPLPLPASADPTGATDVTTRYVYDDAAHTVTTIDPRGNQTVATFDDFGRPVRIADAAQTTDTTFASNGNRSFTSVTEKNVVSVVCSGITGRQHRAVTYHSREDRS